MSHDQGKRVTCQKMLIPSFLCHILTTSKAFILMQTPLELEIWLQSYEEFVTAETT